jgi:hypothetical protein
LTRMEAGSLGQGMSEYVHGEIEVLMTWAVLAPGETEVLVAARGHLVEAFPNCRPLWMEAIKTSRTTWRVRHHVKAPGPCPIPA